MLSAREPRNLSKLNRFLPVWPPLRLAQPDRPDRHFALSLMRLRSSWNDFLIILIGAKAIIICIHHKYSGGMVEQQKFTDPKQYLGKKVRVKIDRPLGSKHPVWGLYYPVNYGFIPGTLSPDGEPLDAYVLGVLEAIKEFTGKCIAIIHRQNDDDDKLVVVPEDLLLTDDVIKQQVNFQEKYFKSIILRR
jgi:inorganic pyrophosphatase